MLNIACVCNHESAVDKLYHSTLPYLDIFIRYGHFSFICTWYVLLTCCFPFYMIMHVNRFSIGLDVNVSVTEQTLKDKFSV